MRDELLNRIERINVLQTKEYRAPHKPLLLLLALGRVLAGERRLVLYETLEAPLKKLLIDFGRPRKILHPESPFTYLRSDGLWEIPGSGRLQATKGPVSPRTLIENAVEGGFPESVYALLEDNPRLIRLAAQLLLDGHFPPSLHDDILKEVGIPPGATLRTPRELEEVQEFRENILIAYDRCCAICGHDVRLNGESIGLDAAHIKWRGPDSISNGLALCVLHHQAFDRGALSLKSSREGFAVMVSSCLDGTTRRRFRQFQDEPIPLPANGFDPPDASFVSWHAREVFRSPDLRR